MRQDSSAASFFRSKLLWGIDQCVVLPCFNAQPDIFAVMTCCVVALSAFPPIPQLGALMVYIQCNGTHDKQSVCRRICSLCQQTSPKRWLGHMNMTLNCDGTNSAHQMQMSTICHWMKTPHENFLRTPLTWSMVTRSHFHTWPPNILPTSQKGDTMFEWTWWRHHRNANRVFGYAT